MLKNKKKRSENTNVGFRGMASNTHTDAQKCNIGIKYEQWRPVGKYLRETKNLNC